MGTAKIRIPIRSWIPTVLLPIVVVVCSTMFALPAAAYNRPTHRHIVEAAWNFIKWKAAGNGDSAAYPTQAESQATVDFWHNLNSRACVGGGCPGTISSLDRLRNFTTGVGFDRRVVPCPPFSGSFASVSDVDSHTDMTGRILGFYAAHTDDLDDYFIQVHNLPLAEAINVTLAALAPVEFTIRVLVCIFSFGAECDLDMVTTDYFIPMGPTNNLQGNNPTRFNHFSNVSSNNSADFDNHDGYNPNDGVFGTSPCEFDFWLFDIASTIMDIHVVFPLSLGPITGYNVLSPNDGHPSTSDPRRLAPFYWDSRSLALNVQHPVDNLAFTGWQHWLEMKRDLDPASDEFDLQSVGNVLHGVADATNPHHAGSVMGQFHQEFEDWIEHRFDINAKRVAAGACADPSPPSFGDDFVIMNWGTTTLSNLSSELAVIKTQIDAARAADAGMAARRDLPVRDLLTGGAQSSLQRATPPYPQLKVPFLTLTDPCGSGPFGEHEKRLWTAWPVPAIERAVAISVAVLVEARVATALDGDAPATGALSSRVWTDDPADTDADGVPNYSDECPYTTDVEVDQQGCPVPSEEDKKKGTEYAKCLVERLKYKMDDVRKGRVSHLDWVRDYFRVKAECTARVGGYSEEQARLMFDISMGKIEALHGLFRNRSVLAYRKALAELVQAHPEAFVNAEHAKAYLSGKLDTDRDGVPDLRDVCNYTAKGVMVDETGCPEVAKRGVSPYRLPRLRLAPEAVTKRVRGRAGQFQPMARGESVRAGKRKGP